MAAGPPGTWVYLHGEVAVVCLAAETLGLIMVHHGRNWNTGSHHHHGVMVYGWKGILLGLITVHSVLIGILVLGFNIMMLTQAAMQ